MEKRKAFFNTYSETLNDAIDDLKREDTQRLSDLIEETRNNGKRLFVPGNGGSATATFHWICDFGKGTGRGGSERLKISSPVDNGAIFNALGNGCGYEIMLAERMKNPLEPDGLVLTFSVSGSPSNLVEAHQYAKGIGVETTCIVTDKGGRIIGMSDFAMIIPSENYGVVEDIHVVLGHAISQQIYADSVGA